MVRKMLGWRGLGGARCRGCFSGRTGIYASVDAWCWELGAIVFNKAGMRKKNMVLKDGRR